MSVSVHNPDQYMVSLRLIIAQGRQRIGLLVGAGAPAGITFPFNLIVGIPLYHRLARYVHQAGG